MKAIVLTQDSKDHFKEAIKREQPMIMLYYASWCGHCQVLHPTWEALKKKVEKLDGISIGEVEYANMNALPASLKNIRGFPTIQVLEKGKVKTEYQGDRRLDSLLAFAKSHAKVTAAPKKPAAAPAKKPAPKKRKVAA